MAHLLDEVVSEDYLKKFERRYSSEVAQGQVSPDGQFEYAWALVRSRYPSDIRRGISLLEDLYHNREPNDKRDLLFYLAVGNARHKEYPTALKFVRGLLQVEPGNRQAQELEEAIKKRMEREALTGMAAVGGAVLAIGGLVGLGFALAKNMK